MRFKLVASLAVLALLSLVGFAQAGSPPEPTPHWAAAQIDQVVEAGVMGPSVAEFRLDDALTWGELAAAVGAIRGRAPLVRDPAKGVKLAQLDAWLVRTAKLSGAAKRVRRELLGAGLTPGRRVATETIARMARFRINHEQPDETREIAPGELVSRGEAAYSFARLLNMTRWERRGVKQLARGLVLPQLSHWQTQVLERAVGVVGFPYVWAGASSERQTLFGQEVSGGFDCSGFTWHVYKSSPFEGAEQLAEQLVGRTSYAMSGEFDRAGRLSPEELQPADLVFFGDSGVESKPREVGHMGIYLGGGWMVHSSRYGTTIAPFSDWYRERFAWGRRLLAEAGLQ